jgi:transcriptional regulator with XRE-family HTH domain
LNDGSTIGERIKAVRRKAGLGQDAFAGTLGYSKRSLISWETGAAEPPVAILSKLRRDYDVDPEWVVMGEDATPQSHYGPADWERFDGLLADVDAVCVDVGLELPRERSEALARVLYDNGALAGRLTRKQIRGTLLALSLGK